MRIGGSLARVGLTSFVIATLASSSLASAQACAPGRVVAPGTEGRCCWPDQTWSAADDRCLGVPSCPDGWGGDGATCVRVDAPETALPAPPSSSVRVTVAATLLADPHMPDVEPAWHVVTPVSAIGPRRVNFNVVGGGLALALSTYAGSLAEGLIWGYCGNIAYFVPGAALVGAGLSASCGGGGGGVAAATGVAFGLGQFIGVFLIVAGATIFRRAGVLRAVAWTRDGLAISF